MKCEVCRGVGHRWVNRGKPSEWGGSLWITASFLECYLVWLLLSFWYIMEPASQWVLTWSSEENLWPLVLYHVGLWDWTQMIERGGKHLYPKPSLTLTIHHWVLVSAQYFCCCWILGLLKAIILTSIWLSLECYLSFCSWVTGVTLRSTGLLSKHFPNLATVCSNHMLTHARQAPPPPHNLYTTFKICCKTKTTSK